MDGLNSNLRTPFLITGLPEGVSCARARFSFQICVDASAYVVFDAESQEKRGFL